VSQTSKIENRMLASRQAATEISETWSLVRPTRMYDFQGAPQTGLVQNDHVIQAFPTNRADQSLNIGVLPGRLRCRETKSIPIYLVLIIKGAPFGVEFGCLSQPLRRGTHAT